MAAASTCSKSCGVCKLRQITKPSIVWCTECNDGLCTECKEHHSLSQSSRSHSVIPFTEYQTLPADILKCTQYCTKHDKKYQIYCQKHELPCCNKCIVESHNECRDLVELDDVIHNVKTSNAMCEIEETLAEIAENLHKIRQNQQDNLTKFRESRKGIETEIKKTRIKINNHLDKLQEDLMKKLYAEEEKENSKICQLLSSLEKKETEIAECQRNIMNIKQYATDIQMFLSMKQIEEGVSQKDKFLQSLVKSENLNQNSISYKINTSIENIMSGIMSFGEVQIDAKSCEIVLLKKKVKQAQMLIPRVRSSSIENIKLTIHKTINTKNKAVHGCCMLPDGRMAFTYYYDWTVKVFNSSGFKDFEVKMPCIAFDIVYIREDNTLAVTSGNSNNQCITIIDVDRKQIKKTISMDSFVYGIAVNENRLIYSAYTNGIRMVNRNDESIHDIVEDEMPSECYTATYREKIYHTNRVSDTVSCFTLEGKLQWTFENKSVLKYPHGIDVDNDGNVYVVGTDSRNVVVISPDGKRHTELLTGSDGLKFPFSLHYSGQTNQLLVANFNHTAHLFNII